MNQIPKESGEATGEEQPIQVPSWNLKIQGKILDVGS
jgi:hypothetical protein